MSKKKRYLFILLLLGLILVVSVSVVALLQGTRPQSAKIAESPVTVTSTVSSSTTTTIAASESTTTSVAPAPTPVPPPPVNPPPVQPPPVQPPPAPPTAPVFTFRDICMSVRSDEIKPGGYCKDITSLGIRINQVNFTQSPLQQNVVYRVYRGTGPLSTPLNAPPPTWQLLLETTSTLSFTTPPQLIERMHLGYIVPDFPSNAKTYYRAEAVSPLPTGWQGDWMQIGCDQNGRWTVVANYCGD